MAPGAPAAARPIKLMGREAESLSLSLFRERVRVRGYLHDNSLPAARLRLRKFAKQKCSPLLLIRKVYGEGVESCGKNCRFWRRWSVYVYGVRSEGVGNGKDDSLICIF